MSVFVLAACAAIRRQSRPERERQRRAACMGFLSIRGANRHASLFFPRCGLFLLRANRLVDRMRYHTNRRVTVRRRTPSNRWGKFTRSEQEEGIVTEASE